MRAVIVLGVVVVVVGVRVSVRVDMCVTCVVLLLFFDSILVVVVFIVAAAGLALLDRGRRQRGRLEGDAGVLHQEVEHRLCRQKEG
jgi:uncharacterized membrane protein